MTSGNKLLLGSFICGVVLLILTFFIMNLMGYRLLKEQDIAVLENGHIKRSDILTSDFFKDTLEIIAANNISNIDFIKSQRDSALANELYWKYMTNTYKARVIDLNKLTDSQRSEIMNINKHLSNVDDFISSQYLEISNLTIANVKLENTLDSISRGKIFGSSTDTSFISVKDTINCDYYYESSDMIVDIQDTTLKVSVTDEIIISTRYVNEKIGFLKRDKYYAVDVTNTNDNVDIKYNEIRIDPRDEKTFWDKSKEVIGVSIISFVSFLSGTLTN